MKVGYEKDKVAVTEAKESQFRILHLLPSPSKKKKSFASSPLTGRQGHSG